MLARSRYSLLMSVTMHWRCERFGEPGGSKAFTSPTWKAIPALSRILRDPVKRASVCVTSPFQVMPQMANHPLLLVLVELTFLTITWVRNMERFYALLL